MSVYDKDKEVPTFGIARENEKNFILNCCYRPYSGDSENLSLFLQNTAIEKYLLEKKISYMLLDFNMICLSYHDNAKTKHFYDIIFEKGAIPIINCPTQIAENSANIIDNILTTDIFNISLKKDIIKLDVSDPLLIFLSIQLTRKYIEKVFILKIKKEL